MNFDFTPDQESLRDAVAKICSQFGDDYWLAKDKEGGFPFELHRALADAGWLGICIPEEYGGAGLGISDAALMMQLGVDGVFVGSGIFKSDNPAKRAKAIVQAVTHYNDPQILAEVSEDLGAPMVGINMDTLADTEKMAVRGW